MSKLNATDIQGFALRGYNMPFARYCFLHFHHAARARALIGELLKVITTGQLWEQGKPPSTLNIALTHRGLVSLDLPIATLISFPVEFQQGMRARGGILGDIGGNSPEHWDDIWREGHVHAWLGIHATSTGALDARFAETQALVESSGGARLLAWQDAAAIEVDGKVTLKEHFGFTDGFGNPDYVGVCRSTQPGQGKLTADGTWAPLATGELLLGYADEAGELPVAPIPHLLASNGTFMVYRKLHQNVGTFRDFLDKWGARYGAGGRCRAGEAGFKVYRAMAGWHPGGDVAGLPRSSHRAGPEPEHELHVRQGSGGYPVPDRGACPARESKGCFWVQWGAHQPAEDYAPGNALWSVFVG